jgi:hypothetical protein
MTYFRELPNLEVINTTKNIVSNDETMVIKNLFKRAKIREDLLSVVTAFDYYQIQENERPDELAKRVYGDPEYDWVILLTNNIINVQDQWPMSKNSFDNYLMDKYGSEEMLYEVKHYETSELKDNFGRLVLPAKLIVDEYFYNAPVYQGITSTPAGVIFPPIYVPGTVASATAVVGAGGTIANISNLNGGAGYQTVPQITISAPPVTSDASASCTINNFRVNQIVGLNSGQGYNSSPIVTVSAPPTSVQSIGIASLGTGVDYSKVTSISFSGGSGYGLTAPTVTFDDPLSILSGLFLNESSVGIGSQIDGMYVRDDGLKLYTSSGIGTSLIREFSLSNAWDSSTVSYTRDLNVTADFSYCTGIEFSPDGTKLFVSGGQSSTYKVIRYDLSIPWNILTATKVQQLNTTSPGGVRIKSDGTKYYFLNLETPDRIQQYTLSSPWDLTTIGGSPTETLNLESVTGDNNIYGFIFFNNGNKLFATGASNSQIYEFNLSTSWSISTATLVGTLYVGNKLSNPSDVYIDPNKTTLFVCGGVNNKLFQYNINSIAKGTASVSNGSVSNVNIIKTGYGYTVAPNVFISAPYPSENATIQSSLSSGRVNLTIVNSGFGYTVVPEIIIATAPISVQAAAVASINNATGVSTVRIIDSGSNYTSSPTITFDPPLNILNVNSGDVYYQNGITWRWSGTQWQEKTTEGFQYFDPISNNVVGVAGSFISAPVTHYQYELEMNDKKRQILLLKPQYIGLVISDLRRIMQYDPLSQYYINSKLKGTYNPKLTGV